MYNQEQTYEPKSFQEKNITVSLVIFSLILVFFLIRILMLVQAGNFVPEKVFLLWGIVAILAVVVTIFATILTHIVSLIIEAIRTQQEPKVEDIQDERDMLIDLRGTKLTHQINSSAILLSMLTFVIGRQPLVLFSLLIASGIVAQIVGDAYRLYLYRKGL